MAVYLAAFHLMASHRIKVAGAADLLRSTGASMDVPCVLSSPKLRDLAIHAITSIENGLNTVTGYPNGSADNYGSIDSAGAADAVAAATTRSDGTGGRLRVRGGSGQPSLGKHHPLSMYPLHVCPIHLAALNRNCDVVATLLEAGASVNIRVKMATGGVGGNVDGGSGVGGSLGGTVMSLLSDTPVDSLHIAVSNGDLDTLQLLLQAGAVPSNSCIHCAVSWFVDWLVGRLFRLLGC